MNLDTMCIDYINKVVTTAAIVGIDNIIIEPGIVRAIDENRSVVILQTENVPDMPFGSIGLNRINVFQSRYTIAKQQPNFTIQVDLVEDSKCVRGLVLKSKNVKIDYRCADPTKMQAPKQINDTPAFQLNISQDAVSLMQQAQVAMKCEKVKIISNNDGIFFELVDVTNDVFSHRFTDHVVSLNNETATFVHSYNVKIIMSLLKQHENTTFTIGSSGTLSLDVNGLNVTVLPQV